MDDSNNGTGLDIPTPVQQMNAAVVQAIVNMITVNMTIGVTYVLLITDGKNTLTASPLNREKINQVLESIMQQTESVGPSPI
jgi:hypothetical protein